MVRQKGLTKYDMLIACVMDFMGSLDEYLHLMEFAYNNTYQATIQMAPYNALYGEDVNLLSFRKKWTNKNY